jgi:serine/threonine-protein kinase HipA
MEARGGLTIPAGGMGGSWIVKLPSARFAAVPENEYAMLARAVGIEVPATLDAGAMKGHALAVQRFDRRPGGESVHMEDFAQVFGLFPDDKYRERSYANIAAMLWAETGEAGTYDFFAAPRVFRVDRQCRHAPQELVAALSRPPHTRPLAFL